MKNLIKTKVNSAFILIAATTFSFACPTTGTFGISSATEYLFTGPTYDNLGSPVVKGLDSSLEGMTIYNPITPMKYSIAKSWGVNCDWSPTTVTYIVNSGLNLSEQDSTQFSIYRTGDKIQITENSWLPLGTMEASVQIVKTANDTSSNGLTFSDPGYSINGDLFSITDNKSTFYFGQLYLQKKDGNFVTLTSGRDKDSTSLSNRMLGVIETNAIETDSVFWQILKLTYSYSEDIPTNLTKPHIPSLYSTQNHLILPEGTQWIKIRNAQGKLLFTQSTNGSKTINLERLTTGLYYVETDTKAIQRLIINQ